MTIRTKIITIIALAILLTVGITTVVLINIQNSRMLQSKFQDTEFLCDLVERTTDSAMRQGNTQEVQRILEDIGKNREIPVLRILSPDGIIVKSTNKSEIGAKSAEFIKSSSKESFLRPTLTAESTIDYFHNIDNRDECFGCHSKSNPVIGVIHMKYDISRHIKDFLFIKRVLIISNIAVILFISAILWLLFSHFVMVPLKGLLAAMNDVENGNWQTSVKVTGNDELGIIGKSFNKMVLEIGNLYNKNIARERELLKMRGELEHKSKVEDLNSQLEFRLKELETANKAIAALSKEVKTKNIKLEMAVERLQKINEIGRILSSIIETRELMKIIIQTTADLVKADKVTMHLRDTARPGLTIQFVKGIGIQQLAAFDMMEDGGEYSDLLDSGRVLRRSDAGTDGSSDRITESRVALPMKMKGDIVGIMVVENNSCAEIFSDEDLELLNTISNQAVVALENASLYENVKNNYFATIQSLVNALEANDRFTKGHSERVRMLSVELGRYIGLDFRELELLEHASILHDIGKIGIDNFILQKNGRLSPKEYGIIKTHPLIGDQILGPIGTLDGVRKTIIQHHERYDGTGYPFGLRGDEISLKSRILSVVDTFDAMMTDRPYRKALSLFDVTAELRQNSGTQFDPYVVNAFVELVAQHEDKIIAQTGYHSLSST